MFLLATLYCAGQIGDDCYSWPWKNKNIARDREDFKMQYFGNVTQVETVHKTQ